MRIIKKILPLLIIFGGIILLVFMTMLRPRPEREVREPVFPFAETIDLSMQNISMDIDTTGIVRAPDTIGIVSETQGKIIFISNEMKDGGVFNKGDILFKIDPREYELRLQIARSEVSRWEVEYARETAEAEIALMEWERIDSDLKQPSPLVLRKPQLESAKASLESAKASYELALLNLERTVIRAPFSGRVIDRFYSYGQYITPGMTLASVYDREIMEVIASIRNEKLKWIDLDSEDSPQAIIRINYAGMKFLLNGRVSRVSAELDDRTRLHRVIIQILETDGKDAPRVLPNMFAEITIKGRELSDVFLIPDKHVHDRHVYIEKDNILEIRPVEIIGYRNDYIIIEKSITEGERLIISPLINPVNGMRLRTEDIR